MDKKVIEEAFKELNDFYEENRKKAFMASMGTPLAFSIPINRKAPTPDELWLQSFLKPLSKQLRESSRNILRGFLITKPISDPNSYMLGIVYHDKKDNEDNEDLFNMNSLGIAHLKPKEVIKKYPE